MPKGDNGSSCQRKRSHLTFQHIAMGFYKSVMQFSYTFVLIFLINSISFSYCQNCGVPDLIRVKQNGFLKETLNTGQTITSLKVTNVIELINIKKNPEDFADVSFNSVESLITIKVQTPLWQVNSTTKSYIDSERADCISVVVKLRCKDERTKHVTFDIPIIDENTEPPRFEKDEYKIETEPCLLERCPLILNCDITVTDHDRDKKNAYMELATDTKKVSVLSEVNNLEELHKFYKENEYKIIGYQIKVKLEIIWDESFKRDTSISFGLTASNVIPQRDGKYHKANTQVRIIFKEQNSREIAPIFSSSVYFICVEYPKKSFRVWPNDIIADTPWSETVDEIQYTLSGGKSEVLKIDSTSGTLETSDAFGYEQLRRLKSSVLEYDIFAKRIKTPISGKNTSVVTTGSSKLIVFFPECTDYFNPKALEDYPPSPADPHCDHDDSLGTTLNPMPSTDVHITENPSSPETSVWTTTTNKPEDTSVTPSYPTRPPIPPPPERPSDHCTCDCTQFSCEISMQNSSPFIGHSYHVDQYYCTKYHQCSMIGNGDVTQHDFECAQEDTVFCPNMSKCVPVNDCLAQERVLQNTTSAPRNLDLNFLHTTNAFCGNVSCTCFNSLWPGDPGNICTEENYLEILADPEHCDIFHVCQSVAGPPNHYFIDYPRKCPHGLVYCPARKSCWYHTDPLCSCNKTFKYCDVYQMGHWADFDIFNKKFKYS